MGGKRENRKMQDLQFWESMHSSGAKTKFAQKYQVIINAQQISTKVEVNADH